MPELQALLEAVQQNNQTLEEVESELSDLRVEISNLPRKYIPRSEAKEKSERVKKIATFGAIAFLALGLIVFTFVLYVKAEGIQACREDRTALRDVIDIAVADRQPLTTSSPETVAALERDNRERIRPLRERLLSLEGTQPEKC